MNPDEKARIELEKRHDDAFAEIEAVLKKIFRKGLNELTLDDKRFLQARRSYLEDNMLNKYKDVLAERLPRPDGQPNVEEEKAIEELTRKELEKMAATLSISAEAVKKAKKNADLQELIKQKQEEIEAANK